MCESSCVPAVLPPQLLYTCATFLSSVFECTGDVSALSKAPPPCMCMPQSGSIWHTLQMHAGLRWGDCGVLPLQQINGDHKGVNPAVVSQRWCRGDGAISPVDTLQRVG